MNPLKLTLISMGMLTLVGCNTMEKPMHDPMMKEDSMGMENKSMMNDGMSMDKDKKKKARMMKDTM